MVTTDYPYHSPEIDYLRTGENGLIAAMIDSIGTPNFLCVEPTSRDAALEIIRQH